MHSAPITKMRNSLWIEQQREKHDERDCALHNHECTLRRIRDF